jgi:nitroreductase
MTPIQTSRLLEALHWRYATQKYDSSKRIAPTDWQALEQALVLTPSSFGIQPWRFLVVDDRARRQELVAASYGQTQPVDASHFVVFAVRQDLGEEHVDRYVARTAAVRDVPLESLARFKKGVMATVESMRKKGQLDDWNARQLYIALGQFMTSAALLGIDTSPMEGISLSKYDEILGLTGTGWKTVVACAAGYRAHDDKYAGLAKVRFPVDEVVRHV